MKNIKGRKRHIVVDTPEIVMTIVIRAANILDCVGAKNATILMNNKYLSGIQEVFNDGGYHGELIEGIEFNWAGHLK